MPRRCLGLVFARFPSTCICDTYFRSTLGHVVSHARDITDGPIDLVRRSSTNACGVTWLGFQLQKVTHIGSFMVMDVHPFMP